VAEVPSPCSKRASSNVSKDEAVIASTLARQYSAMPSIKTGRRPKRSESGPITNWPTPKPIRNVDSTACGRLAIVMWNAEAMLGSAGSIISMASGFRAMIEAITTTNSGKPIGRWLDETQAAALISVTLAPHGNSELLSAMLRCTTHFPGWLVRY
jgi:hypothetical protein